MGRSPSLFDREKIFDSKLQPPSSSNEILSRLELFEHLASTAEKISLLTVIAPAGSGKTTLLTELFSVLETAGIAAYWLSLDAEDNEPVVFAKYLVTTLRSFDTAAADKELAFLKANPTRDFAAFFDSLLARIAGSGQKFAIFIDDFQHITHPGILRFWNRLIAHAPSTLRIVIASRTRTKLDLARKRVSGSLIELDQEDLNFNLEQLTTFMCKVHAIDLTPDLAQLLHNSTEGWVAGLQLAALAIGNQGEDPGPLIRNFSGRDKDLTEYLIQTVLDTQSTEAKAFLLQTSTLIKLSSELCDAVTHSNSGAGMLEYLERSNLFIVPLDRERKWFRYHHLFAEFLQNELKRNNEENYSMVCERAATWYEEKGQITEAIQYCLSGGKFDKATNLIAERAPEVAQYLGDHYTILDWMRRLPEKYHDKRPELLLNHAWSRAFSRDLDAAISLSDDVLRGLDPESEMRWQVTDKEAQQFRWLARIIQAIANICADELQDGLVHCQDVRKDLPDDEPFFIASIFNSMSYCHFARREHADGAKIASQAYIHGTKAQSVYAKAWADFLSTINNVDLGRINAASESAQRAASSVGDQTDANTYVFGIAALAAAEVEAQRCNFPLVEQSLQGGKGFSSVFGPLEPLLVALRNEARLKAWKGELGAAKKILKQGQDTALGTNQPRLYFTLVAEEIDLELRFDDIDSARQILRQTNILDVKNPLLTKDIQPTVLELGRISEAKLKIAEEHYDDALRTLSLLAKSINLKERVALTLSLHSLRSIALWKIGRENEAVRELDRALSLAAPEDHALPIVSAGNAILEILDNIRARRTDGYVGEEQTCKHNFESKLIAFLRGGKPESPDHQQEMDDGRELLEAITDRELELLRLIGAGLDNKQLADELLISVSTVKWHLHNVYGKIGVKSRTAAAAHARRMSLI